MAFPLRPRWQRVTCTTTFGKNHHASHTLSSGPFYNAKTAVRKFGVRKFGYTCFDGRGTLCGVMNIHTQHIDGVPFRLVAPFDFSFLRTYGTVFKVFDEQESGNMCFGVVDGGKKRFVKFAGAPTMRACVSQAEAVALLKAAEPMYRDLAHPNLVTFIDAEEVGGGFAMVFEWTDAECIHRDYPASRENFLRTPLQARVNMFEAILDFHARVAAAGYVAIDFYEGGILYDFARETVMICDIDLYAKRPYVNRMGRLWGSSRFMSPEEFIHGATIDEITNVYTMGATAFVLLSNSDRSPEAWPFRRELYHIVRRAVSDDRNQRQPSIQKLIEEWQAASPKRY